MTPWRNGSASDSRSEGCVFESRRGQNCNCVAMFLPILIVSPTYNSMFDNSTFIELNFEAGGLIFLRNDQW